MRAVVLAAGVGSRLSRVTGGAPKVLVHVGGDPLLRRSTRLLAKAGVRELVVVIGYRAQDVRKALSDAPVPVRFVENPRYAEFQTYHSLMLTRTLVEDEPFLKLNGDVIFEPEILQRLLDSPAPLALAVDESVPPDEEAIKVVLDPEGFVRHVGKKLPIEQSLGESIGIEKIEPPFSSTLFDHMEAAFRADERNLYYEDVFQRAIDAEGLRFFPVPIGGLRWAEIDDEKDLERAHALFDEERRGAPA